MIDSDAQNLKGIYRIWKVGALYCCEAKEGNAEMAWID